MFWNALERKASITVLNSTLTFKNDLKFFKRKKRYKTVRNARIKTRVSKHSKKSLAKGHETKTDCIYFLEISLIQKNRILALNRHINPP